MNRLDRIVSRIYSATADRVYDRVVVGTTLPLLGGRYPELIDEQGRHAAKLARGRPVLDMPIGTAHFAINVARHHEGLAVGVDLAEGMVRKSRQVARDAGLDNLVAVQADAHHLPFADGSFGAITCVNGLPVIPGPRAALGELARVLAADGTLLIALVSLPLSAATPRGVAGSLPVALSAPRDLVGLLRTAGLDATVTHRSRLATLFEARRR